MIEIDGSKIPTDEEGYLVDPAQWNEAIAARLAQNESVVLGEVHWQAIRFMRRYFEEHQIAPDARFVVRHLAKECGLGDEARKRLFELFPYGYVKQACKIAGMRRPRAWSTG